MRNGLIQRTTIAPDPLFMSNDPFNQSGLYNLETTAYNINL